MVFASGIAAVLALLTLVTLIKKNLSEVREGVFVRSDCISLAC